MSGLHLRKHWDRIRTEPGLGRNVGVWVMAIVLAVGAGGWILSEQNFKPPWSNDMTVNAEFAAVPGVSPGNGQEVRVAGVIVGNIAGAEVNDRGLSQLKMTLKPGTKIYDNATLVLRPKSALNEMYVTIAPGGPPGARVESGHTFSRANTRRPIQVDEVLGSLDDDARASLTVLLSESDDALASAPADLGPGLEGADATVTQLGPVVDELDQRRDKLRRLVAAAGGISQAIGHDDERLTSLATELQTTLDAVGDNSGALGTSVDELPEVIKQLQGSTDSVSRLSKELDPTLRDLHGASSTLPTALQKVTKTSRTLDSTLKAAKPTIREAKPVVADLRPFVGQLQVALPELQRTTARLDPVTASLVKYLPDLGAFFVNTRSVTSLRDGNGGILRGLLEVNTTTTPTGLLKELTPPTTGPKGKQ